MALFPSSVRSDFSAPVRRKGPRKGSKSRTEPRILLNNFCHGHIGVPASGIKKALGAKSTVDAGRKNRNCTNNQYYGRDGKDPEQAPLLQLLAEISSDSPRHANQGHNRTSARARHHGCGEDSETRQQVE